ncbi:hypothetical protein CKAH01_18039 [Colletotrichum kahawae]|uniref:F-box domain-containing protein n=1 Tax=Colletotrichum kahawae TaxID=34407 RepID=A0AAD9YA91_COLKA|nr:hypothetical protein CKAH01_18039 [Colletotrichum kahawae]
MADTETCTDPCQARRKVTSRKSDDKSAILQLPMELLVQVIGYLGILDKAILSRTCAALRIVLDTDWAPVFHDCSRCEKRKFWRRIVYDLPEHWFCLTCGKIEPINQKYLPYKQWTPPCQRRGQSHRSLDPYQMRSEHVQMALKLSRLGNINQGYLKKIMAPFSIYRRALKGNCLRHYRAVPKIVAGNFLLQKQWKFQSTFDSRDCEYPWNDEGMFAINKQLEGIPLVCPHLGIAHSLNERHYLDWERPNELWEPEFEADFRSAIRCIGHGFSNRCYECKVEYAIWCPNWYTVIIRSCSPWISNLSA